MSSYAQAGRPLALTTPLGADALTAIAVTATESLSHLFRVKVTARAPLAKPAAFDRLLGHPCSVALTYAQGKQTRHFHGLCAKVVHEGSDAEFINYSLELVPQLWLLSKRSQSRIFQHVSVPEILKVVLAGLDVSYEIKGTFHARDFCVQYRETDFAFASRLMEEEGIFYYFQHTAGGHKMVVANTPDGHKPLPGGAVKFKANAAGSGQTDEHVLSLSKSQAMVAGKVTLWDHTFELPHKHLEAEKPVQDSVQVGGKTHPLKVGDTAKLELYDSLGEYAQRFDGVAPGGGDRAADLEHIFEDNARVANLRMQEEASTSLRVDGISSDRRLCAGHKFTLETVDGSSPLDANGKYVLLSVQHTASMGSNYRTGEAPAFTYTNSFSVLPEALPYRPLRRTPKPVVPGSQSAVVVGPAGEEIFTDKYGRVKVQFHWDRQGKRDANSSCWVRVGTVWAGRQWGVVHIPRVGQEVLVDFLEGDPDQPIIVGSVFNPDQMPAYKLPDERTKSYIRTNTSPGGEGHNEIRFEDKKDKQQIYMHAEKDVDVRVKHDRREIVLHDQDLIVGEEKDGAKVGDYREKVFRDRHVHILRHREEHVEGNAKLTIGKGDEASGGNLDIVIDKQKQELIGTDSHLHVVGNQMTAVDKSLNVVAGSLAVAVNKDAGLTVTGDLGVKVDGGHSTEVAGDLGAKIGGNVGYDAGQEIHLKAGMKVIIEAGAQLTIKGPGGFVDIGPAGVTIQGIMVKINSGGTAGSGSGAKTKSPKAPAQAKDAKPAKPAKAIVADNTKSGHKSN